MSSTTDPTGALHPAFTLTQLATLMTWSTAHPSGLRTSVAPCPAGFLEVVEVYQHDSRDVRYVLNPTKAETIVLAGASGDEWELPTVEAAVTKLLELEGWGTGA